MIALRRESNAAALVAERVLELPQFVSSSKGSYWHIPRSAIRFADRLSVQAWCGVTIGTRPLQFSDVAPSDNICGTCSGRFEGAQRTGELIFAPRDDFAVPRWCPGDEVDDERRCLACGSPTRAAYGWWSSGTARHAHAPAFAERCTPCPDHGWSRVAMRAGRVACFMQVGYGWGTCDFDCGPRS